MQGSPKLPLVCTMSALLLGLAIGAGSVSGQGDGSGLDRPHFGIGYVANAPRLMAGGGAYVVTPYFGGIGIYLDAKFDVEDPSSDIAFVKGITADDVVNEVEGAEFIRRESSYRSFNAALLKPVTPYLMVYAGGGLTQRFRFHFYEAPGSDLGVSGIFWVKAPAEDDTLGNFMTGVFMRVGSFISTQVGIETEPRGFTAGVSLRLPRR